MAELQELKHPKRLEELNALDNFMFGELANQADKEAVKQFFRILLETFLQKKVWDIHVFPQYAQQGRAPFLHGIQMDTYVEAYVGENRQDVQKMILPIKPEIFDIEPNTYETDSEERRMRYYRAVIDTKILEAGLKYKDMKNVTLIMISNYDPFKRDRMIYTIKNHCVEEPDMEYEDGVKTLFLYAYGKKGSENEQLADLLKFLADSRSENVKNADIELIQQMMSKIKRNAEIGVRYMQSWEIKQIYHDAGYDAGYGEGFEKGMNDGMSAGISQGISQGIQQGIQQGIDQGIQQGIQQGIEQGIDQGISQGLRTALYDCLFEKGELIPVSIRDRIEAQQDAEILRKWLKIASKTDTFDDFEHAILQQPTE